MKHEIINRTIAAQAPLTDEQLIEKFGLKRSKIEEMHKGLKLPGRIIFQFEIDKDSKPLIWYGNVHKAIEKKSIFNVRYEECNYLALKGKVAPLAVLPCNNLDEVLLYVEYFNSLFCEATIVKSTEGDCEVMMAALEFPCRVLHALTYSKGCLYFSILGFPEKDSKKLIQSVKLEEVAKPFEREGENQMIPLLIKDYKNKEELVAETNSVKENWYKYL